MNQHSVFRTAQYQLAVAIGQYQQLAPEPLPISPWLAMSLLQKAIRRGHKDFALRAAATLLIHSPERLWRRCGGITFEDIGLADPETLAMVTAALAGKRVRASLGGEWAVASFIVSKMVCAPKCRAADDLLMSAELHPANKGARHDMALMTPRELSEIAARSSSLHERALALWYLLGTDRRTARHLAPRRGEPQLVFDLLKDIGCPNDLVEIAREGFRKIREPLCPFVALLSVAREPATANLEDDPLPAEAVINRVPGWVYDIYTREGRAALLTLIGGSSPAAKWVRAHIPPVHRVAFLGAIVFRVEGGLVRRRMRLPIGDELRRQVDFECHGRHCPDATEILELMCRDIPVLNEVRRHAC